MSEIKESRDFPLFTSSRPSRAAKKKQAEAEEASSDQSDAMLTEICSLGASLGNIDGRLSAIDSRLDNISTSVVAIQESLSNLTGRVASNESRLTEAEARISAAEDGMLTQERRITSRDKELSLLRAKIDDLENRGRWKNLRIVGLPEKAEGSDPIVQYLTRMLPKWLDLTPETRFEIERAHRSLGPVPGANHVPRSVLVRFLRYVDKELILQAAQKKRYISHEGIQLRFFQDVSAEVLKKRREFDEVRKKLSACDMFRGFAYPAKLRCLHGTQMHFFFLSSRSHGVFENIGR
ncbi:LINE-1 type transposase domain-containing 1 [Labeo rohita]|uniref:LINE-1 type transposase domain-containing 1 n=1 Tax=Labeo rohita TaxID=84645 RepID=A0A498MRG2_LABRO|nr:LINE-1 type transposase domain-containing 1 [Labeo rohita]